MRLTLLDVSPIVQLTPRSGLELEVLQKALRLFARYHRFPCNLLPFDYTADEKHLLSMGYAHLLPHAASQFLGTLADLDGTNLITNEPLLIGAWIDSTIGFRATAYGRKELKVSQLELELLFNIGSI